MNPLRNLASLLSNLADRFMPGLLHSTMRITVSLLLLSFQQSGRQSSYEVLRERAIASTLSEPNVELSFTETFTISVGNRVEREVDRRFTVRRRTW